MKGKDDTPALIIILAEEYSFFFFSDYCSFETGNGIVVEENGVPKNGPDGPFTAVQGSNAYRSPDGSVIQTQFIADENGYQAIGDHLPTPPPPHPIILKALEYLASLPSTQPPPQQKY
jgi:hypothetical protein